MDGGHANWLRRQDEAVGRTAEVPHGPARGECEQGLGALKECRGISIDNPSAHDDPDTARLSRLSVDGVAKL